jgi:hypothetical protein
VAGTNMTIIQLPNHDLQFNAIGGSGGGGEVRRMMTGEATFSFGSSDLYYERIFPVSATAGKRQVGLWDSGRAGVSEADANNFSTIVFTDINHMWNLTYADSWLLTLVDSRPIGTVTTAQAYDSIIKAVPINANTIRLFAGYIEKNQYDIAPEQFECTFATGDISIIAAEADIAKVIAGMTVHSSCLPNGKSLITEVSTNKFAVIEAPIRTATETATFTLWNANNPTGGGGIASKQPYLSQLPSYRFTLQEYK